MKTYLLLALVATSPLEITWNLVTLESMQQFITEQVTYFSIIFYPYQSRGALPDFVSSNFAATKCTRYSGCPIMVGVFMSNVTGAAPVLVFHIIVPIVVSFSGIREWDTVSPPCCGLHGQLKLWLGLSQL